MNDIANFTPPLPDETELRGNWIFKDKVSVDAMELRICYIIQNYFEKIAKEVSGWDTLYRDPVDGRLWELTYTQSEMQGGGPQLMTVIGTLEAQVKYKIKI